MYRLTVFLSILIISPEFAIAQSGERSEYFSSDTSTVEVDQGITDTDIGGLKIENKIVRGNLPWTDTSPELEYGGASKGYHDDGNSAGKYMVSVDLGELLWSGRREEGGESTGSSIMIGLKKPHYRISEAPFINGRLDLRLAGSLFGIENRGFITLSYDLRTERRLQQLSSKIAFEQIRFALYFPLGKKRPFDSEARTTRPNR